ncbi:MAG TPA: PepSY-associated TM helix domain-containing protein [Vicinamibacterales bacterium]|nr:PepSY-associated TM helix domain-containing protein [Vicinamibacterales bacterium]
MAGVIRPLHRTVGLVMLLPFLAWAATGLFFFIKPGYSDAYASLSVKTYPIDRAVTIVPPPGWREFRVVKTILGDHVLARTDRGWAQFDPQTMQPRPEPAESDLRRLLLDAFSANPARYGSVVEVNRLVATTDTGVHVTIDWGRLSLSQRGRDTDRIDGIYKIHYLQWTGVEWLDRILGGLGLALIVVLSVAGVRLFFKRA